MEHLNSCVSVKNLPSIGVNYLKYKMREKEINKDGLPPLEGSFSQSMSNLAAKYREDGIHKRLLKSKKLGKSLNALSRRPSQEAVSKAAQEAKTLLTPREQENSFSFQKTPLLQENSLSFPKTPPPSIVSSQGGLRVKLKKTPKKTTKKSPKKSPKKTTKKTTKK
jgi:hypothetical protein